MTNDADTRTARIDPVEPTFDLEHVTIEPDDAPAECALFPRLGADDEFASQWMTAQGGSFVDLESMR